MKTLIQGQEYTLQFGFGFLRKLGEKHGLDSYQDTIKLLSDTLGDMSNLSFKQEDFIKDVLLAAAETANCKNIQSLNQLQVIDFIMAEPETFKSIISEIEKTFPKTEGKPQANPQVRKTRKVKK